MRIRHGCHLQSHRPVGVTPGTGPVQRALPRRMPADTVAHSNPPGKTHAMFQTFDEVSDPTLGAGRVAQLREWLAAKNLDGFIVPRSDEHQGEYVAERSERLKWLTGFTGSAGVAIVLGARAVLFVDGRYTLQARQQVDPAVFGI